MLELNRATLLQHLPSVELERGDEIGVDLATSRIKNSQLFTFLPLSCYDVAFDTGRTDRIIAAG